MQIARDFLQIHRRDLITETQLATYVAQYYASRAEDGTFVNVRIRLRIGTVACSVASLDEAASLLGIGTVACSVASLDEAASLLGVGTVACSVASLDEAASLLGVAFVAGGVCAGSSQLGGTASSMLPKSNKPSGTARSDSHKEGPVAPSSEQPEACVCFICVFFEWE